MARTYLHYDVFTREPLVGNQLAVFVDGEGLPDRTMQAIAREMNFSESTFILPAEASGTDIRMRIFTPGNELPMAGHPTIGSTFALADTGVIAPGTPRFVFGLNIGPTPVDLEWNGDRLQFAWMTQSLPAFGNVIADGAAVTAALSLGVEDLADLPIQPVSCGVEYLLVPLRDHAAVDRAVSDAAASRRLASTIGVNLPIFLFAIGGSASGSRPMPLMVYSRMFAASFGIAEDPATGSASGPLGCYLVRHGITGDTGRASIVSDQGVAMGRPSRIHIAIAGTRDAITEVKVGGEAVLMGRGELLV